MSYAGASAAVSDWLKRFEAALAAPGSADWTLLFAEDATWRDMVAFTWNIATVEGLPAIKRMISQQAAAIGLGQFVPAPKGLPAYDESGGWFAFETAAGRGLGKVEFEAGKCTRFFTELEELKGFEEPIGKRRRRGVPFGAQRNRKTWLDERAETARTLGYSVQPYCLVVGGGQNGLALAARLKRLSVPALVIDSEQRIGDAWRKRYKSLYLHGPSFADHMPFLPFPDHWPLYSSKDQMGDWLEIYAKAMELDVWTGTRCLSASFDESSERWSVKVNRDGEEITLQPVQLVLAAGLSGAANVPSFPGAESFAGSAYHSSRHGNRGEEARGKNCVVIGSTNSAHDIAQDLWEHEAASVTMIQRSPTILIDIRSAEKIRVYKSPWADPDLTTRHADLVVASLPFRSLLEIEKESTRQYQEVDADLLRRLDERGFKVWTGEDETGLGFAYLRTASGYYIEVGASQLVADGEIVVQQGDVAEILPDGVKMEDGTVLPADVLVYATGYRPLEEWVGELISPEVQAKVGRCWGLGSGTSDDPGPWEGELRNMWKPTPQKGLWFQAGSLNQTRPYSQWLALQLKARMENLETPVYDPLKVPEPA